MFQYTTAIGWTQELLKREEIPFVDYFQPALATRATPVEGEPDPGDDIVQGLPAHRDMLPKDTVDLAGSLDDLDEKVYVDDVHTNELGASHVAEAMWADLSERIDLAELAKEPASCR